MTIITLNCFPQVLQLIVKQCPSMFDMVSCESWIFQFLLIIFSYSQLCGGYAVSAKRKTLNVARQRCVYYSCTQRPHVCVVVNPDGRSITSWSTLDVYLATGATLTHAAAATYSSTSDIVCIRK